MHIALNAWFWNRPDTGSGQYVRQLAAALAEQGDLSLTLIAPQEEPIDAPPGVTAHSVRLSTGGQRGKLAFEQRWFPRAAAEVGADLIHVPYWAAPLSSPLPLVVTVHDLIPMLLAEYRGGLRGRLYTALVAASTGGAGAVITDSQASRADIIRYLRIPAERVHVVPLAAGVKYHPRPGSLLDVGIRQKYNLPSEYLLYLGGYDVRKNVHTLLKAFTYVQDGTGDQFPLVLAGRLPEKRSPRFLDMAHYIELMGVGENVRLIGEVDETDKPALYRMARAFVFPSRYEGFGLPVLEAMSCGTPVVAANTSSLPEIVGEAGFLVDPDDARHMAGAILSLLVQDDLHAEMREKALARAAAFTWPQTAAATRAIYERVLMERPPTPSAH
ncbi:MAG: glycosyltransferase family 1 protein [Anaerolineae bacterium]